MSAKKQTAVKWLEEQLIKEGIYVGEGFYEQAKAMEREQIIEAFDEGQEYEYQYHINGTPKFDSETYFIETYKGGNK